MFVHFAYDAADQAKGYYSSSNDGLSYCWKSGLIKPSSIDLAAVGGDVARWSLVLIRRRLAIRSPRTRSVVDDEYPVSRCDRRLVTSTLPHAQSPHSVGTGACFLSDIIYAVRQSGSDTLSVAFYGTGACPKPIGDIDEIGYIPDFRLSRSIREVAK